MRNEEGDERNENVEGAKRKGRQRDNLPVTWNVMPRGILKIKDRTSTATKAVIADSPSSQKSNWSGVHGSRPPSREQSGI